MDKQAFDEWLEKLRSLGMKPGLSRVKELLTRMDNPQNKLDIIHITGTNGKGTTATLIRNILIEGGYKVGQFSSPSIISFNHMFDIAGPISDDRLYLLATKVKSYCDQMFEEGLEYPTEYEVISAMMYQYFFEEHVDYAVVEVAMGGTNDCTNVMDHSILSVITPISLDHVGFLGANLLEIAKEKSGVIKHNSVMITHPQAEEVHNFLRNDCDRKMTVFKTFEGKPVCQFDTLMAFSYEGVKLESELMGVHMADNIIGAIEVVKNLNQRGFTNIGTDIIKKAILNTSFEGRFERLNDWILDGAHNHQSLMALKKTLDLLNLSGLVGVFSCLKDKDIDSALKALKSKFKKVIILEADSPRKLVLDDLACKLDQIGYKNIIKAKDVKEAYEIACHEEGIKLGFGSFYMIAGLRKEIKKVH